MKRIAFLTDIHLDEQFPVDNNVNPTRNLEIVLRDLREQKITEIVFGGDIGESTAHKYFFDALKEFSVKLILGNHDKFEEVKESFIHDTEKDELYYESEDDYYKYIFLDSSSDELSVEQLEWVQAQLATNKALVLFIHHPILEIDTPVDKIYPLKNRERLKSILVDNEKSVTVFCGHYHMNDEQNYRNIKQFITQSLSYQLLKKAPELEVDNANFGYRIIELANNRIESYFVSFKE